MANSNETYLSDQDLDLNTEYLTQIVSDIDPKLYVEQTEKSDWSIQDICEHILLIEKGILMVMMGPVKENHRNPHEMITKLKSLVPDRSTKVEAPKMFVPKGDHGETSSLLIKIAKNRKLILANLTSQNDLCEAFPHFIFGHLTKIEWTYFIIYHADRHITQIQEIKAQLNKS